MTRRVANLEDEFLRVMSLEGANATYAMSVVMTEEGATVLMLDQDGPGGFVAEADTVPMAVAMLLDYIARSASTEDYFGGATN